MKGRSIDNREFGRHHPPSVGRIFFLEEENPNCAEIRRVEKDLVVPAWDSLLLVLIRRGIVSLFLESIELRSDGVLAPFLVLYINGTNHAIVQDRLQLTYMIAVDQLRHTLEKRHALFTRRLFVL